MVNSTFQENEANVTTYLGRLFRKIINSFILSRFAFVNHFIADSSKLLRIGADLNVKGIILSLYFSYLHIQMYLVLPGKD